MHNKDENKKEFETELKNSGKNEIHNLQDEDNRSQMPFNLFAFKELKLKGTPEENIEKEIYSCNTQIFSYEKVNFIVEDDKLIDYFSNLLSKYPLEGVDELIFMELSDDIKFKIYERITS
jgi:hypothetical protein